MVTGCAYACTGNVLEIQKMLHLISEHVDPVEGDNNTNQYQTAAVISIGLIAFGEDIGTEMCKRIINHMIQYGEPHIKQAIPLAIALLGITKPENNLMDLLQRLSYDQDANVAINALLATGVVWSGTNNS